MWIGLARGGPIPLSVFVDRGRWWIGVGIDLGLGLAAGLLLVGLWRLGRHLLSSARVLEAQIAQLLGDLSTADAVGLALLSGFAEELFFRGAVQSAWGFLPATVLFALLHTGPGRAFRLWSLFALVAGLLFAALVLWRGNLLSAIVAHAVVNGINLSELAARARRGMVDPAHLMPPGGAGDAGDPGK